MSDCMPPLEDTSDIKSAIDGEALVARRALNVQVKEKTMKYSVIKLFILDAMLIIRCVV